MYGVLASTTTPDTKPLDSWLPSTPESTQPLFLKKKPVSDDDQNHSRSLSNFSTPSPTRSHYYNYNSPSSSSSRISRKSVNLSESGWKQNSGSGLLNTRDELLMSLMASEAVVDSRGFDILTAEEVEDYKKEYQLLSSRLGAMTKKLALETKIRDAALSLCKVNASHKKVSQQTTDQLNAANARVDSAQKEYWKVSNRASEVHKKLMEHRAGVLSFSVRSMEKKLSPQLADNNTDSGYDSSNRSTLIGGGGAALSSPTSTTSTSSTSRFDGAHLFAGHADTIVPKRKLSAEAAAAEIASLEEKLKAVKDSLTAAGRKQAEMARELSMVRLEKQEVETMMGMDLQAAEETIAALDKEIPRLEMLDSEVRQLRVEKGIWEQERAELMERGKEAEIFRADMKMKTGDDVEKRLADIRENSLRQLEEKESEIEMLKQQWEDDRIAWQQEMGDLEDKKMEDLARLQDEMDRLREEDDQVLQQAGEELNAGLSTSQDLIKKYGIVLLSRDSSLQGLLNAIGMHIQTVHTKLETHARAELEWDVLRRGLEDDVRSGLDNMETLSRELEDARRGRDAARRDTLIRKNASPHSHSRTASTTTSDNNTELHRIMSILQPLWAILPSPEVRAAKFGSTNQRSYRTGSPTPSSSNSAATSPVSSLSELDVRSLKSLYDATRQTPTSPAHHNGTFTIEAFVGQVQALISDDRALIERLLRFAQAHDMLKKNADRAQKLAREGTLALETYQKQVRMLEERNMGTIAKQAAYQDEIQRFQSTIDRLELEKRQLESLAAEQAETYAQLNEANNTLSARTLTLAEEAANAPEMVRKQLEAQLSECRKALDVTKSEVDELRNSEQSQNIVLLDELNEMQTENANLRAQLRAMKK